MRGRTPRVPLRSRLVALATFLLILGATARLTRLITTDVLLAGLRHRVEYRFGDSSLPAYLITCTWCMGLWIGTCVTAVAVLTHANGLFVLPAVVLTTSYLVGLLSGVERRLDA